MTQWNPVKGQIMTKWAEDVDSTNPYPSYPRPQMKRDRWLSLNGLWNYVITRTMDKFPTRYDDKILVPYPIESALSGVKRPLKPREVLWYHRMLIIPPEWHEKRILLNFGAVDWNCIVYINKHKVGSHQGGFGGFFFDITEHVSWKNPNEIFVAVQDPTNKGSQPRGKQILKPWAAFYTAISGIWQTIWIEPVSNLSINTIKITPIFDSDEFEITVIDTDKRSILKNELVSTPKTRVIIEVFQQGKIVQSTEGETSIPIKVKISEPKYWSSESPQLYDFRISLVINETIEDTVLSYSGLRKIEVKKDSAGIPKIFLNDEEIFQLGVLDQGYFPDGLYTAPNEEALYYDANIAKDIGLNMIRKHVKIEPAIWYHHCDKIGILVWQDMPYAGSIIRGSISQILFRGRWLWKTRALRKNKEVITQFEHELQDMVEKLNHFPSIITWVIFNEGWGQHRTIELTNKIREWDSSRLIDSVSGWVDKNVGDMRDLHKYPGPMMPELEEFRVSVNGEFGGLGLKVPGHMWKGPKYWAYQTYKTQEELQQEYAVLLQKVKKLKEQGLTTAIYTQISDVEQEINGYMTYDRILKYDKEFLQKIHRNIIP
ncbi:MAG: beta-galactosidase [Candidatus Lokiarchaeota archaeon]|nr:beta-galactosidase [Candidatus Lokiarchaeota archaeon]